MLFRASYRNHRGRKTWKKIKARSNKDAIKIAKAMQLKEKWYLVELFSVVRVDEPKKVIPEKVTMIYELDNP